jgi:ankyrin repeat protein
MTQPSQDLIDAFVGSAHGDFAKVKELLEQHPSILNLPARWGEYAIEAAAQTGQVDIAEYLLERGAPKGLCTAAMLGHIEEVAQALHADPNAANATGAHGIGILYHAVIRGHTGLAQMLLDYGADINGGAGGSPALHGAVMFNRADMAEWLLARGADVNILNYENKTPLTAAREMKRDAVVAVLQTHSAKE